MSLFDQIPDQIDSIAAEDPLLHLAAQMLTLVGREDLSVAAMARAVGYRETDRCPETSTLNSLMDQIIGDANRTQIVMINESHFEPRHRLVASRLAERLKSEGYTYYAAETLQQSVYEDTFHGRILFNVGSYSFEPIFGRGLREIYESGYSLEAYEQRPDQRSGNPPTYVDRIHEREVAQTENLIAAIFDQNPGARVLIHVGHSHVLETPRPTRDGQEIRWFANRLAEATGIDPVTIDQTHCRSDMASAGADGNTTSISGAVDYFIGHPPLEFDRQRPTWRREIGDIDLEIPTELLSEDGRIIVEAHPAGGPTEEVAIDRLMVFPGENIPLLLPPGQYDLRSYTSEGLLAGPVTVTVSEKA
ncbi:MAG: hypothetical protein DHS20C06_14990 [Hyphobacterium sp.]|nr:MAG: hypothetical protein DHS20C06_14990 [Hyphobacterium sp.]